MNIVLRYLHKKNLPLNHIAVIEANSKGMPGKGKYLNQLTRIIACQDELSVNCSSHFPFSVTPERAICTVRNVLNHV